MLTVLCSCAGAQADTLVVMVADAWGGRQLREQCWAHEALSSASGLQNRFRDARARLCWVHTGAATAASLQQRATTHMEYQSLADCAHIVKAHARMLVQAALLVSRS